MPLPNITSTMAVPARFEEIHRAEMARYFGRVVGIRALVGPLVASVALAFAYQESAPWRRILLVLLAVGIITVSLLESWRFRRQGMTGRAAELNISFGVIGQAIGCLATGGLESPAIPFTPILTLFVGMIVVQRRWHTALLVGFQLAMVWFFGAVTAYSAIPTFNLDFFGGGARGGLTNAHIWTNAVLMTLAIIVSFILGRALRSVFDAMLSRALESNEESLRTHAERSQELLALSGEIAHELKNPLASVKGLAALLKQNVNDGKGSERLGVLTREIVRMQEILDEFLNFSRPLVPLCLEQADLDLLCREVVALHEGTAREKSVNLIYRAKPAPVNCDPRKTKQILINLLQNALDVSPAGSSLEIQVEYTGQESTVSMVDQGAGIDASLEDRIFEPGVTTKSHGSGLGLTIARALARQHGGELTLKNRAGGGCIARLRLPRQASISPEIQHQEVS